MPENFNASARKFFFLFALVLFSAVSVRGQAITNLQQLTQALASEKQIYRDVRIEATVCAATAPADGVLILQDATDVEVVEFTDGWDKNISPGEKIRIEGENCLLRRRDMGAEISAAPVVDNDGVHIARESSGEIFLTAGRHPLALDWFNQYRDLSLAVTWQISNAPPVEISAASLSHTVENESGIFFEPGLLADCYEGNWESVPDFETLQPVKSVVVSNFDLGFRTQDEMVGIRFMGFFDAPHAGNYVFHTRSDDGSLLFIGESVVRISELEKTTAPEAIPAIIGEPMNDENERRWVSVEGRVSFVSPLGKGLELKLQSERESLRVRIVNSAGLDASTLLGSRVRVTGAGCGVFNLDRRIVLGELFAVRANDLEILDTPTASQSPSRLTNVRQVQSLPLEDARRNLPVNIHGVVTSMGAPYDFWLSIQDDTRGIFVDSHAVSNSVPACGDFCEISGHSGAGDFAPIIVAEKIVRLGKGELPEPARPTWNELINGSMDVQWVEFQGLVTDVHSNMLSMLLPDGQINVQMEGQSEVKLAPLKKSVVRIRGVLFAIWNADTREVRVGSISMRNASFTVDIPAPIDSFNAVVKTPRELLLFDAQAAAFRRVKVRGQIVHADANQIFLMEDGAGLRLLPSDKSDYHLGDLVEAVGYPDISGPAILLRETQLRKTGAAPLSPAKNLSDAELSRRDLDSTRVRVEGKLLGWHLEQGAPVLEMQSGAHLYLARLGRGDEFSLRAGSKLALQGVYVSRGGSPQSNAGTDSFELLLNSPADIAVLSQPSWWTLQRLLVIVGILLVILFFAVVWITQLRRQVEQRTAQLQRETQERERVERQHALEAERSRIARDLHDDLGSSLTEIGVLASTGQRPQAGELNQTNLFHSIAEKARSLIAALDVIVWAVDPEDNSLQSLADYLSGYAEEFFSHTNISCRFKVPMVFSQINLEGRVRHDLLMAVKETLNNIVRHAEATEVEFRMAVSLNNLEIEISDNGKGFERGPGGHGLKNLSARLLKLGGSSAVESRVGGGTMVKICLPLPADAAAKN